MIHVYHSSSLSQKKSIAIFLIQLGLVLTVNEISGSFSADSKGPSCTEMDQALTVQKITAENKRFLKKHLF